MLDPSIRRQPGAIWDAHYFDGRSADRRPATVEVTGAGLVLRVDGGADVLWQWDDVRQTQGFHKGEVVRFERGSQAESDVAEAIVVEDTAVLRAVQALAGGFAQRFHDPRLRAFEWPFFVGSFVSLVALGIFAYTVALPAGVEFAADRIPIAWEEELGKSVVAKLAPPEERCSDPAREASLSELVGRLVGPKSRYRYRVTVAKGDMVNAFAAPGGYVVVFDGLLRRTTAPEELAGVLAHEIEHVEQRHATRALLRELSTQALIGMVLGDAGALQTAVSAAGQVAGLSYRRHDEESADVRGMARMKAARLDPKGMVAFFKLIQEEDPDLPGGFDYLSTHPRTADRIATLEKLAAGLTYEPLPALPGRDWEDIRKVCR